MNTSGSSWSHETLACTLRAGFFSGRRGDDVDTPTRARRRRSTWTRVIATVLVACLVLGTAPAAPASAQGFVADADTLAFQMQTLALAMVISLKIPPLIPIVFGMGMAMMAYTQAMLWSILTVYDTAIVYAWTTENLLALNYQLRSTISLVPDYVRKLRADQAILEKRIQAMDRQADREIFLKNLQGPEAAAVRDAVALERGFLEAVNRKLEWVKQALPPLNAKCEALLGGPGTPDEGAIGRMRREWLAGQPRRDLSPAERGQFAGWNGPIKALNRSAMAAQNGLVMAFADYVNAAAQFHEQLFEPVRVPITTSRGTQERAFPPTASEQLRVTIANESKDLIYFVKVVPGQSAAPPPPQAAGEVPPCGHEPGDLFQAREIRARRGWMALYPKDATLRMNPKDLAQLGAPTGGTAPAAGPVGADAPTAAALNPVDVQFPSSIWFPVEPGDRVEFRAATYGEHRKGIRWLTLQGSTHRPELESVRRNFYYLGYEVAYGLMKPKLNLRYSISESYTWSGWIGAWARDLPAKPEPDTSLLDFYEAPPWVTAGAKVPARMAANKHTLDVTGDRYSWTVPETREAREQLDKDPFMRVKVGGRAQFVHHVNAESLTSKPDDQNFETGEGELAVNVEPW
jgi:hypothetical protein